MEKLNYRQLKQANQDKVNSFKDLFFAFSAKQFAEGMESLKLLPGETDKIINLGNGGFVLKTEWPRLQAIFAENEKTLKDYLATREGLLDALEYELANHEYAYTYEAEDTLESLGLTSETVDPEVLSEAIQNYWIDFNLHN